MDGDHTCTLLARDDGTAATRTRTSWVRAASALAVAALAATSTAVGATVTGSPVTAAAVTSPAPGPVTPGGVDDDGARDMRAPEGSRTEAAPTGHDRTRAPRSAVLPVRHDEQDNAGIIRLVWPASLAAEAVAVSVCESGLESVRGPANPDGTHDWGLFQLNDGGTLQSLGGTPARALDPEWNAAAALRLYHDRGWQPWTCARTLGLPR